MTMNTLSKAVTGTVLGATNYESLRRHWATLVRGNPPELGSEHYLLYLALLGRDWRWAFAPITNRTTLANGGYFNWRFWPAIRALHSRQAEEWLLAPFAGLVSVAHLDALRPLLPNPKHSYRNEDILVFQPGRWPFDAYREPSQPTGQDAAHAG
jgi:hypothetical protein